MYIKKSYVVLEGNRGQDCGAITIISSWLIFEGNSTADFFNNHGHKGRALSFYADSFFRLATFELDTSCDKVTIILNFVSNSAEIGGAIYVEDSDYIDPFGRNLTRSIFELKGESRVRFSKNTASFGGNDIYGAIVDGLTSTLMQRTNLQPTVQTCTII